MTELRAVLDTASLRALVRDEVEAEVARQVALAEGSPWMTRQRAAEYVHVSQRTLDRHARQGRVRLERVGTRLLFHRDDLDRYVRGGMPQHN